LLSDAVFWMYSASFSSRDQPSDVADRRNDSAFSSASRRQWSRRRSPADWQRIWLARSFANAASTKNIGWCSDVIVDGRPSLAIHRRSTAGPAVTWRRRSSPAAAAADQVDGEQTQDGGVASQRASPGPRYTATPASVSIATAHTHNGDVIDSSWRRHVWRGPYVCVRPIMNTFIANKAERQT